MKLAQQKQHINDETTARSTSKPFANQKRVFRALKILFLLVFQKLLFLDFETSNFVFNASNE